MLSPFLPHTCSLPPTHSQVFSLPDNAVLDEHTLERVLESGHSRVPIHRAGNKYVLGFCIHDVPIYTYPLITPHNAHTHTHTNTPQHPLALHTPPTHNRQHFIGLLLVKELVLLDPEDCVPITQAALRPVPYVSATLAMYDLLTLFATGRSHMVALVDTAPVREGGETLGMLFVGVGVGCWEGGGTLGVLCGGAVYEEWGVGVDDSVCISPHLPAPYAPLSPLSSYTHHEHTTNTTINDHTPFFPNPPPQTHRHQHTYSQHHNQ